MLLLPLTMIMMWSRKNSENGKIAVEGTLIDVSLLLFLCNIRALLYFSYGVFDVGNFDWNLLSQALKTLSHSTIQILVKGIEKNKTAADFLSWVNMTLN